MVIPTFKSLDLIKFSKALPKARFTLISNPFKKSKGNIHTQCEGWVNA